MDISNVPDREFRVIFIKILFGLEKKMEDLNDTLKKRDKKQKSNLGWKTQ